VKRFYLIAAAILIAVFFIALLVPGVSGFIETRLLSWVAGAAS
jgi:hypothetical protein